MRCARCDAKIETETLGVLCPVCLLDAALPDDAPEEGIDFHYDLIEEIARGGMGVLYRALQHGSHRQVAVKMLLAEQSATPGMMERFLSEAEAVASLDHPHILPIYEIGEIDGRPFYSMKLVNGGSLRDRVEEFSRQPRGAARVVATIARAIHHAHERGILHRDLKPGNILLDGVDHTPYVADFGIAKWLGRESRLTLASTALGTPQYIAPEQTAGSSIKLTPAADVYSLGAILYELLTGQPPFVGETPLETLRLSRETEAAPPRTVKPAVPRDLEVICLKCLAKEPSARYPSAAALAEDLERWLEGHTILARPTTSIERGWRWTKRNRIVAALSAALVAALVTIVIAWIFFRRDQPRGNTFTAADKSIAVLPFSDESAAHGQTFLCDGLSEEVLDTLSKVAGLRVIGRASSFAFRDKDSDVVDIGRRLNVGMVLEGAVQRSGDSLRISAELLNVNDKSVRWSHTYERNLRDLPRVRDEIARAIADELKLTLTSPRNTQVTTDPVAYDSYLQGLYYSNKSSEEDLRKALSFFQRALDRDPNFARAWSGIAKTWSWLADEYVRPLEAYPISKAAALKAIALDDRDTEAHVYLGAAVGVLEWDWNALNAEALRALEIDPNSASAHISLALSLSSNGFDEEAFPEVEAARKLDPLSIWVSLGATVIYLGSNRIDDAVAEGQRMLAVDPNYSYFDETLAMAYRERGQLNEAIALYEKALSVNQVPRAGLAITYVRAGRIDDARRVLTQLLERSKTRYVQADAIASVYVALGEKEEAFRWLERAVAEHSTPLEGLGRRPVFRPLQSDPRFADLLRRVGLNPAKVLSVK
jgi:serine/threonine-protein kinase